MTVLVVGASGATGRLLVEQLLDRGVTVRIIVRPQRALPENLTNREHLITIRATILELSDAEMAQHVKGCDAVAACLGHNMSLRVFTLIPAGSLLTLLVGCAMPSRQTNQKSQSSSYS